jgi:hypothetical protein
LLRPGALGMMTARREPEPLGRSVCGANGLAFAAGQELPRDRVGLLHSSPIPKEGVR